MACLLCDATKLLRGECITCLSAFVKNNAIYETKTILFEKQFYFNNAIACKVSCHCLHLISVVNFRFQNDFQAVNS